MEKPTPPGRDKRPGIKHESPAAESDQSRIWAHLTHRQRLSKAEERVLDRDGDGRVTSRDLYLVQKDERLTPMPEVVPSSRVVSRGDMLELGILGSAPRGLEAKLRTPETLRPLDVEVTLTKRRTRAVIRLPEDVESGERVDADLWLSAPGYTPRRLALAFAKRPAHSNQSTTRPAAEVRRPKRDAR